MFHLSLGNLVMGTYFVGGTLSGMPLTHSYVKEMRCVRRAFLEKILVSE